MTCPLLRFISMCPPKVGKTPQNPAWFPKTIISNFNHMYHPLVPCSNIDHFKGDLHDGFAGSWICSSKQLEIFQDLSWWANFAKAVAVKYNGRAAGTFRIFLKQIITFNDASKQRKPNQTTVPKQKWCVQHPENRGCRPRLPLTYVGWLEEFNDPTKAKTCFLHHLSVVSWLSRNIYDYTVLYTHLYFGQESWSCQSRARSPRCEGA